MVAWYFWIVSFLPDFSLCSQEELGMVGESGQLSPLVQLPRVDGDDCTDGDRLSCILQVSRDRRDGVLDHVGSGPQWDCWPLYLRPDPAKPQCCGTLTAGVETVARETDGEACRSETGKSLIHGQPVPAPFSQVRVDISRNQRPLHTSVDRLQNTTPRRQTSPRGSALR